MSNSANLFHLIGVTIIS